MDINKFSPEFFNQLGQATLPGHLGITITGVSEGVVVGQFQVAQQHLAPNGFLHAGSVVTLADTVCGYACVAHLPAGAENFTTIELKSNHLGTARDGVVVATAKVVHLGRTTQVWDATVVNQATGKTMALFRCTQMILYPK
ncbi:hotdog fold thioesterase [Pseudoduganella sp. FT93W]|uniref:Hotdog fold thioesterase n=1 Tax=Duganella fentianensis TaxID=2692177 RepID=A0A845I380_9BURK|nr:PaaI family thioesterase [Duganella fentianensis]MYN46231.1 hotdog fold thioesterase [Duganella fentianensis]